MDIDGRRRSCAMPDGIHLNEAGSQLAANTVTKHLKADFASLK